MRELAWTRGNDNPRHGCGARQRADRGGHEAQPDCRAADHNKVSDLRPLAETAGGPRETGRRQDRCGGTDGGYYKIEDIESSEANGVTPFVPKASPARVGGRFPKSYFRYDATNDTCACPADQRMVPLYPNSAGKTRDGTWVLS